MTPRSTLLLMTLSLLSPPAARAQGNDGGQDWMSDLKSKDSINAEDRGKLRQWIELQLVGVSGEDLSGASQAINTLSATMTGTATQAYREAYVAECRGAVAATYKTAENAPATQMLSLLTRLNDATTYDVFVAALKDSRPAIRMSAAVGLRNLRPRLNLAGGKFLTETLAALRDAGGRETSKIVLQTIYQAMNFPGAGAQPVETKPIVEAVLGVLETRAKQYAANKVRAEGAEVTGLKVGSAVRAFMDEAQQKQFIVIAAEMLRYGVHVYVSGEKTEKGGIKLPMARRRDTELLIREAERVLREMLKPPADVNISEVMRKANTTAMTIEFNKWAKLLEGAVNRKFKLQAAPADGGGG